MKLLNTSRQKTTLTTGIYTCVKEACVKKACVKEACVKLAAAALLLSSWAVSADTYRWVDANGVVNYAEKMPRGVPSDQVTRIGNIAQKPSSSPAPQVIASNTTSTPASSPTRSGNQNRENLTAEQQRMLDRLQLAEQERQASVEQIRRENCSKSQEVLANLSAKDKIRVNMPDGSQRALPESERQERIKQAQEGVVRNCNS